MEPHWPSRHKVFDSNLINANYQSPQRISSILQTQSLVHWPNAFVNPIRNTHWRNLLWNRHELKHQNRMKSEQIDWCLFRRYHLGHCLARLYGNEMRYKTQQSTWICYATIKHMWRKTHPTFRKLPFNDDICFVVFAQRQHCRWYCMPWIQHNKQLIEPAINK